jgi:hypothetical protein
MRRPIEEPDEQTFGHRRRFRLPPVGPNLKEAVPVRPKPTKLSIRNPIMLRPMN